MERQRQRQRQRLIGTERREDPNHHVVIKIIAVKGSGGGWRGGGRACAGEATHTGVLGYWMVQKVLKPYKSKSPFANFLRREEIKKRDFFAL